MSGQSNVQAAAATPEPRLRFGLVAEQYDRTRPGYPEALIDVVLDYGRLVPGDRGLDVGAGTGQATIPFAERGLEMLALDPSVEMTEIANRRFEETGLAARAITGALESTPLEEGAFALVCAATSWHWLDPAVRFHAAARALAPEGTLAVLHTWPRWRSTSLCPALDDAYRSSGAPLQEMGPMYPHEPDAGALAGEWVRDTRETGLFAAPQGKLCSWSVTYSASGYTQLLGTYGDHIGLSPAVRAALFDSIELTIEEAGGTIDLPYATLLLLARTSAG